MQESPTSKRMARVDMDRRSLVCCKPVRGLRRVELKAGRKLVGWIEGNGPYRATMRGRSYPIKGEFRTINMAKNAIARLV